MKRSEKRNQKRKEVVEAIIHRKEPVCVVARTHGVALRTVFTWLARYRSGGWSALQENHKTGRPGKVRGEDMKWLYDAITMRNPFNYKLSVCLWSLRVMRTLLKQERGIDVSKSSLSRLLNHMGLSPQRPVYKAYKQNPDKIQHYLSETFPKAMSEAKRYGAQLYFADEASIRSDAHRGLTWGKQGETPVVRDSGSRFGVKMISAVSPRGDLFFEFIEDRMNSDAFISFLEHLRQDAGKPILVVVDNARYHHSKAVKSFLNENVGSILLAFLPPYSPELNPDEQVWNHTKRALGQQFIANLEDMKMAVLTIMKGFQKRRDLIQSFFCMKDTKYIALPS